MADGKLPTAKRGREALTEQRRVKATSSITADSSVRDGGGNAESGLGALCHLCKSTVLFCCCVTPWNTSIQRFSVGSGFYTADLLFKVAGEKWKDIYLRGCWWFD